MRVEETVLNTLLPAVEQGSEVYYFLTLYEGRYMPHFIVVPEIMDSSVKPMKTKDRYLNTDHIVSFQGEGEERCLIKTVNGSLDVQLSVAELFVRCQVDPREGISTPVMTEMDEGYPQKANVGLPRLAGMDHSSTHEGEVGLGKLGEMQLGEPVEHDYLIREAVPQQAITIGPLYLMVKKTTGEFVLYNVYSNARTSHILRQVYKGVNQEFIRRNLADEIGDVEVTMLGRAATYNHEQVIFHVNPYSDQFDSAETQSWTVDRKLIVTPGSQYDENGLREVEWEACEDNKRYIVAVYQRDGVPDCKVFDYRNIHLEVANKGILKTTLSRARYLPTANSVLEDTYQVVDKPALHHPSRATFKLYKSPDEVVVATRDPILKEINKGN